MSITVSGQVCGLTKSQTHHRFRICSSVGSSSNRSLLGWRFSVRTGFMVKMVDKNPVQLVKLNQSEKVYKSADTLRTRRAHGL